MDFLIWLRIQWDRAAAIPLAIVGLIVLLIGWEGASNTPHLAIQIPYFISGGLLGIFLVAIASTLWLSADMRDEWRELRRIRVLLEAELGEAAKARESAPTEVLTPIGVGKKTAPPTRRTVTAVAQRPGRVSVTEPTRPAARRSR